MVATATEKNYVGDVVKRESPVGISRDDRNLNTSGVERTVLIGTVLSSTEDGLTAETPVARTGNTGDGVPGAATLGIRAVHGRYKLECVAASTDAGTFSVTTPDGRRLADLTVAVAYATDEISMTIADGSADFVVGDIIYYDVTGERYMTEWAPEANDGSDRAEAILLKETIVPATGQTAAVVLARNAQVSKQALVWPAGVTADEKEAALVQLAVHNIFAREVA